MNSIPKDTNPLVVFTPSGKRGHFPVGTLVLDAARKLGVDLDSVCGGRGICTKCLVVPEFGDFPKHGITATKEALSEWNSVEHDFDKKRGLIDGRRLGCQATIQGDVVIDVPPESQVHQQLIRKDADDREIALNPAVKLYRVTVEEPDMHVPKGDFERLKEALLQQHNLTQVTTSLDILKTLQKTLRKGYWTVTCAIHQNQEILEIWSGEIDHSIYGLAFDVGSTTIACHLCDLATGKVVESAGLMNPQIRYGEDLMSRISYAMMNPGGDKDMTQAVQDAINTLIRQVCKNAPILRERIFDIVLVANPVIHHLLLGLDPTELGGAPFALTTNGSLSLQASDLNLRIHPRGKVYVLPCIAGHVGADAAAVALAESPHLQDKTTLIVDVGTNAEIFLGNKTKVLACSSPTGPAFEGAQISSGQRAAKGAIERVRIDPTTQQARFKVIGCELWSDHPDFSADVTGICGSGIIETIAEMRLAGIMHADGIIDTALIDTNPNVIAEGRTASYILHRGAHSVIQVTQNDVRAIQLAKAALYAGARLLMDEMKVDSVERILLAGAFGAHISPLHAMVLGMIPNCPLDQVVSIGNAAGTGSRMALLNKTYRDDIESIIEKIEKIETAIEPRFQEHFVDAMAIPHKTATFSHLTDIVILPQSDPSSTGTSQRRRRRSEPRNNS